MGTVSAISTTMVVGHEPSLLPVDKQWKLVWHDEFDGTELDRTKWDFRINFWGKRFHPQLKAATSGNIHGGYGRDYKSCARARYNYEETPDGFHRFGLD